MQSRILVLTGVFGLLLAAGVSADDVNVAPLGTATQSTTLSSYVAELAIDGNLGNFTHTLGTDAGAWWKVDLGSDYAIKTIVLHNRTSCCGSRLRDITVQVYNADEIDLLYESPVLNPENGGFTFPDGPPNLTVDLSGEPDGGITGQIVKVTRAPDPDLSGTGGQGNQDEANGLGLGEVEVLVDDATFPPTISSQPQSGVLLAKQLFSLSVAAVGGQPMSYQWKKDDVDIPGATGPKLCFLSLETTDSGAYSVVVTNPNGSATSDVAILDVLGQNIAQAGTATQSTMCWDGAPSRAINGVVEASSATTHTCPEDANPTWEVDLGSPQAIQNIIIHNRKDCCSSRLRDITVYILDSSGEGEIVLFTSALLNAENVLGGGQLNVGPDFLEVNLIEETGAPVEGRVVRITRTPDEDLSGTGGAGNADEPWILSMAEVWCIGEAAVPRFDPNPARCGTASQSTTCYGWLSENAIDGNRGTGSHTCGDDVGDGSGAWWQLDLPEPTEMHSIMIWNRDGYRSRLRDITVTISDDTKDVLFESPLLNPDNELGGKILNQGPAVLTIDLVAETGGPVVGTTVRVTRTPDPDLSGTSGEGNDDEGNILTIMEFEIQGPCPDEKDVHCNGLTIEGPLGGGPGDYTVTADAVDDAGDLLSYQFTLENAVAGVTFSVGPQQSNTVVARLGAGTWDVTVKVDDSLRCSDDAADATCTDQVVVEGDPDNLALGGVATQSTVSHGGIAYRAIDGFTDGTWGNGSVSATADDGTDTAPWWEVDLGGLFPLARIVLWNRTDCCGTRLENYRVAVLDAARAEVWTEDYHTEALGWGYPDPSEEIVLPEGTAGQFVRIDILGPGEGGEAVLSFAEVQVFRGEDLAPMFRRGDSNRDGSLNLADAVYTLQNLFAEGPPILCPDAADSNDDEAINIADAIYILQNLFADGPDIPAPGPDACGPDTTGHPEGDPDLEPCDYPPESCPQPAEP